MAIDIGRKIKDGLHVAGNVAETAAESIKEKAKDIKIPEINTEKIKETFKKKENTKDADEPIEQLNIQCISVKNAVKILYYLMAADGTVCQGEKEKFNEIGKELIPDFMDIKDEIFKICQTNLDKIIDPEDYYDVLQDGVENALLAPCKMDDAYVTPKILAWDLLDVAYSDDEYSEIERRLLKYFVRKTSIDKAVFLEMESSLLTLMDLEKELSWVKTTNKPYLTIEAIVNEIADRKNVVLESVKALILL